MNNDTLVADQAQSADEERTKRLFVGFLASVLGVDQTMNGADSVPAQRTGQYIVGNPDGTYSVQGQSSSNLNTQSTVAGFPVGLLLLAGLAYVVLKG